MLGSWLLLATMGTNQAMAHKPSFANNYFSFDSAFAVQDPDISIVLYAEMTCTESELWMEMETGDRDEVWVELGVPMLDRLEAYRPSVALVAPGLPAADLPFDLPADMGATIISTADVNEPVDFYEPFSQTESWILYQGWLEVPPNEQVYLVAWNPAKVTGKLWVAVGKTDDFSDVSFDQFGEWIEKTQDYYEFNETEEHVELDCSLVADPNAVEPSASQSATGCASVSEGREVHFSMVALLCGLLVGRRRATNLP